MTMNQTRVHIRWAIRKDMDEVVRIDKLCFADAWEEEDWLRALANTNCIGMVAEHGETVVGFMLYELSKGCFDLMRFAVHQAWRRQQVGTQMVAKLKSKLAPSHRNRLVIEVPESNLAGQLFFRAMGFQAVRTIHADGEDAYRMVFRGDSV